jgi:hypothetical protein
VTLCGCRQTLKADVPTTGSAKRPSHRGSHVPRLVLQRLRTDSRPVALPESRCPQRHAHREPEPEGNGHAGDAVRRDDHEDLAEFAQVRDDRRALHSDRRSPRCSSRCTIIRRSSNCSLASRLIARFSAAFAANSASFSIAAAGCRRRSIPLRQGGGAHRRPADGPDRDLHGWRDEARAADRER